ncbi:hypothetical protein Tco_1056499 [Tanacetum coccineum]|uniref:Uncharacterized protein n=1 Tax=Tanacetum coccineum TaxID=301880 RepID=A0ABQ5H2P8_9ASTR
MLALTFAIIWLWFPNVEGPGYTKETIRVEYEVEKGKGGSSRADDEGFIMVKKKKSGANGGTKNVKPVSMKPKPQYRPKVNQVTVKASTKKASSVGNNSFETLNVDDPVTVEVESGNNASTSDVQEEGISSTPLVEKIHRFEQQLLDGECVLVDEDGKPVKKVDYSGDQNNENEVEPDDNEMARFLASKSLGGGYSNKCLLE